MSDMGDFLEACTLLGPMLETEEPNYASVGLDPPHGTVGNFGSPYEVTQASSTVYCSSCNEFSDMKRDIAEILSELKTLRTALHHLSYDVSLVTEKLAERDEKDEKDKRAKQVA
ncbi:hypothetical protein GMDG_03274 [Pseudogymnoascus destructans 20631-21]|uniref:Uncharacterized protein n=1 Tax=Pseudogymnoascus destructans (strain ATCC MYA-4855 / 20631-21) TaxID=658429 RepID=L8G6X8_PSED2|nr:hypothetical protein GMDG_03274 [Pseudogymnoascus destructans 20631-21]